MTSFELVFICAFTTEEFALALPHGLGTKDIIMHIKKIEVMFSRKMDEISLDFKAEIYYYYYNYYYETENEKKRKYNSRFTEIEQGTFTPLVFTTTGGMADECLRYNSRLAELLSAKKQESYATKISWVRAKVSFAILQFFNYSYTKFVFNFQFEKSLIKYVFFDI